MAQLFEVAGPVFKAHCQRNAGLVQIIVRQLLGLVVVERLKCVLAVAQEQIRLFQFVRSGGWQIAFSGEDGQHRYQLTVLQFGVLTATDQLKRLDDEFHFPDATGTEFDVVFQVTTTHFRVDHGLHRAQRLKRAVVDVHSIGKRTQNLQQSLGCVGLLAGHHPRLDHGVTLPVAPLILVILFHRIEVHHQRATLAIGTQAHVGAEYKAVDGVFIQRRDQLLTQLDEVFLIADDLGATGVTAFRVGENQVDVRTQVEFVSPEFAHAEHQQVLLLLAVFANWCAVTLLQDRCQESNGATHALVGQIGYRGGGGQCISQPQQVAPDDLYHGPAANNPQTLVPLIFGRGIAADVVDPLADLITLQ